MTGVLTAVLLLTASGLSGVESPTRAKLNWVLNCQGCHQADATGSAGGAPNMAGLISRFLSVEGGRAYLGRVPGVANAPLSDAALAELLNWSLQTFDANHIPDDFTPYTAQEVGHLRAEPFVSEAAKRRAELTAVLDQH